MYYIVVYYIYTQRRHKRMEEVFFTIRLKPAEAEKLAALAKETARSRGAVIRQLLKLADLPEARRILGVPLENEIKQNQETTK
jgi:hypothetical protein